MARAGRSCRFGGIITVLCVVLALQLLGCRDVQSGRSTQFEGSSVGLFPPGSDEVHGDWTHTVGLYVETSDAGSMYRLQDKTVWIRVETKDGMRLLDDRVQVRSCQVIGRSTWREFGTLEVELLEEGSPRVDDPYSAALAKSGARSMLKIKYRFNEPKRAFERVD